MDPSSHSSPSLTDVLDGYTARSLKLTSKLGAILDPICDKFFASFALGILYFNGQLNLLEIALFLSREIALAIFTVLIFLKGSSKNHQVKPFISGKIMTSCQFIAFILLTSTLFA